MYILSKSYHLNIKYVDAYVHTIIIVFICRYNGHLKDAKKLGVKKGASTGLGIAMTSFFIFFVHAVGFWFGAYLIQYHDVTSGDVFTVSYYLYCVPSGITCVLFSYIGIRIIVGGCVLSWPSCSEFAGLLSGSWSSRIHI